jgi:hypothetical protein
MHTERREIEALLHAQAVWSGPQACGAKTSLGPGVDRVNIGHGVVAKERLTKPLGSHGRDWWPILRRYE